MVQIGLSGNKGFLYPVVHHHLPHENCHLGDKKSIPHFQTHPNDFECSTVQAYSSLFKPVQPSFEGDPNSLIQRSLLLGQWCIPRKKSPCQNRNTMTIQCGGTVLAKLFLSILWLLNQTDISQWDLLINTSQSDRNFRAKLPSVFWLRPSGIWLYRSYTVIASTYVPQKSLRDPQSNVAMENHIEMEGFSMELPEGSQIDKEYKDNHCSWN